MRFARELSRRMSCMRDMEDIGGGGAGWIDEEAVDRWCSSLSKHNKLLV